MTKRRYAKIINFDFQIDSSKSVYICNRSAKQKLQYGGHQNFKRYSFRGKIFWASL